ncbi:putative transposase-like protein [Actinobacillus equuli]|nr:putative transposase-like protein [Actinobacillus equuli]
MIRQKVIEIYQDNDGNYGYRRITLKLRDFLGAINHKRVQAIMQQLDLKGKRKQRKYRSYKGEVGKLPRIYCNKIFTQQRQMKIRHRYH